MCLGVGRGGGASDYYLVFWVAEGERVQLPDSLLEEAQAGGGGPKAPEPPP